MSLISRTTKLLSFVKKLLTTEREKENVDESIIANVMGARRVYRN